jgi:8-oxo-dGTP pyrophosphatase MutT (NUDIX family)
MHTVFINDKPLRFVSTYEANEWKGNTSSVFISEIDLSVEDVLLDLEGTTNHPGIIYMSDNADISWQIFISYCQLSEAAGGIVVNERQEYLVILRHSKWDLPKGKLDYEETPEAAAVREVSEECGIAPPEIIKTLEKTFHTFELRKKRTLKKTHWFLMKSEHAGTLTPQAEEDIEEARWMTKDEIKKTVFANTYASIKELLEHSLGLT